MTRRFTIQFWVAVLFAAALVALQSPTGAAGGGASTLGKSQDASSEAAAAASAASAARRATQRQDSGARTRPNEKRQLPTRQRGASDARGGASPSR